MIFNKENVYDISREVRIHDYIFAGINYLTSRNVVFQMYTPMEFKYCNIVFYNVIGFKMSSCDFWGASPYILDIEYCQDDKREIIPSLFSRLRDEVSYGNNLKSEADYIEICIVLSSGDKFFVACEAFKVDELLKAI